MKTNALLALSALNTAGLLALGGALALRSAPTPPQASPGSERLGALEERLARLEAQEEAWARPAEATRVSAAAAAPAPLAEAQDGAGGADPAGPDVTAIGLPDPAPQGPSDGPVTRGQVEALITAHLERREAAQREKWQQKAARPKRPLKEVAVELGLNPNQEAAVRQLYRQLERDSMKVLFGVDDAGLEGLKAQLAQAEHDPRLKEQLREQVAVNWTRRQAEVGVLWVQLDARLREQLGPEQTQRLYQYELDLEQEFPDIKQMFFASPEEAGEKK